LTVIHFSEENLTLIPEKELGIKNLRKRAVDVVAFCAENACKIDYIEAFPVEEFKRIAEAELLSAPLRDERGGLGLGIDSSSVVDLLMLLKDIGRANLTVGRIYEGHVNALQLIQTFGTPEQIEDCAEDVCNRHKIYGVWNAEEHDGVKIFPLGQGKYRLEGSKTFATGCGYVDRPFVNGTLPDGTWQMCIVPMEAVETVSDPNWWRPMGMRATASYKVDFTGVVLDQSELIGQPGDYFRQPWLTAGVVRFAAVQLGGAEALFDAARQFLRELGRTKDPYQEERFGKMAIALESGCLWLKGASEQLERYAPSFGGVSTMADPNSGSLVAYASMVRTAVEQICMETIQLAERSVGTRGLLPPHPIERIVRDLTLYLRQPAFDAALATVGKHTLQNAGNMETLWRHEAIN
jgi:alkylation response protein AidB-like acyl-CoA dehydrogenase